VASDGVKIEADQAAISELIQKMQEEKAQKQRRNKSSKAGAEDNKVEPGESRDDDGRNVSRIHLTKRKTYSGKSDF